MLPPIGPIEGQIWVFPDFQTTKVSEEPVCIEIFRHNPVITSLHLRSPIHVLPSPYSKAKEQDRQVYGGQST
jgi:hypothetical protein